MNHQAAGEDLKHLNNVQPKIGLEALAVTQSREEEEEEEEGQKKICSNFRFVSQCPLLQLHGSPSIKLHDLSTENMTSVSSVTITPLMSHLPNKSAIKADA